MPSFLLSLFHSTLSSPQLCVALPCSIFIPSLRLHGTAVSVAAFGNWSHNIVQQKSGQKQEKLMQTWSLRGGQPRHAAPDKLFLGLLQAAGLLEWKCRSWSLAGNGWGDIFIISVLFIPFKSCFFLGYCYDPSLLSLCPHPLIKQNSQGSQRVFCAIKADPVIMSILQIFLEKK